MLIFIFRLFKVTERNNVRAKMRPRYWATKRGYEVHVFALATIYIEESLCLFGLDILVATGIQFVNTCIEPLGQRQCWADRSHWSPQFEHGALKLLAPLPPPPPYASSVFAHAWIQNGRKHDGKRENECHLAQWVVCVYFTLLRFFLGPCLSKSWKFF